MLSFPNCKINLGLYITRKRVDGYHDIETVFYPLSAGASPQAGAQLSDVLEIVPVSSVKASAHAGAETRLHVSGLAVAGNETDNLVWKAYELLRKNIPGKIPPLDIYLHKVIPMGAGLGGGSADAADMLHMLNGLCNLELNNQLLAAYALQLGSDCPFFIYNKPQFATGRGEQMSDIAIDLSEYSIQLICPLVHISTRAAFQMISPKPVAYDLRTLNELPVEHWREHIDNDFEEPVFKQYPELADIKQQLYDQGALYAAMSGSGSAIYGIFSKKQRAEVKADVAFEVFYVE